MHNCKAGVTGPAGQASAGSLFWPSMLSAVSIFSRFGSFYFALTSVVRLLDFHNRSSKIIVQEVSIDDQL